MPSKQSHTSYRTFEWVRLFHYCDLVGKEKEDRDLIAEVRGTYPTVRKLIVNQKPRLYVSMMSLTITKPIADPFKNIKRENNI